MLLIAFKVICLAVIIAIVGEVNKLSSLIAALIASLPLTSFFALIWMHFDEQPAAHLQDFSYSLVWMVLPSLAFFVVFPVFLKMGKSFWLALVAGSFATIGAYSLVIKIKSLI